MKSLDPLDYFKITSKQKRFALSCFPTKKKKLKLISIDVDLAEIW